MEDVIRQYLAFFKKEGRRRAHPLSIRSGGYIEEMATITGILISSPESLYNSLKEDIANAFSFWRGGCELCEAKKEGFLFLIHKFRDRELAEAAWGRYIDIQRACVRRWYPGDVGRIFYHEVIDAMEFWGNDAFLISPAGEIIQVEKTFMKMILIEQPESFGFTHELLKDTYKRHDESFLMEKDAWAEIKGKLLSEGWVFVSFDSDWDRLTVNVHNTSGSSKDHLRSFSEYLLDEKVYREDTSVKLINSDDEVVKDIRLNSIRYSIA